MIQTVSFLQENIYKIKSLIKSIFFVINLCNHLNYHSEGYYCSLLAQARGHKVLPDIEVINRLESGAVMRLDNQMQKIAFKWMQSNGLKENESSTLDIFFRYNF